MLLRAGGFYASAAGLVPGAMPAWNSVGTVYTNGTVNATHSTIPVPAHLGSGLSLLLLCVSMRNNESDAVLTSINTAGWTQFGGAGNTYASGGFNRLGLGWKIGNGSETTVSITCGGGATTDNLKAIVHRFDAANGFAAVPVQGIATQGGSSASILMPTVVPNGNNQRAVCVLSSNASQTMASATGESGGDWTSASVDNSGTVLSIGVQTSAQTTGTTITNGSVTITSVSWVSVGFTLVPALI